MMHLFSTSRKLFIGAVAIFCANGFSQSVSRDHRTCTNQSTSDMQSLPRVFAVGQILPATITPTEAYANKLYTYLTGAPAAMNDPRFLTIVEKINAGQYLAAAQLIVADPNFLKITVRDFAIPFIDVQHQPQNTLTDLQALIIGITRDEIDARQILTGNLRYSGYSSLGLPPVSRLNNDHYAQFESMGYDFVRDLQKVDGQWEDLSYVSGAFTTRAWAAAYYNMGTNRLAVKFSLAEFLCTDIDTWKIAGIPDGFVRRDVTREDGGDPRAFQNTCRNCHGAMDAMGGAFAKLDFTADSGLIFNASGVVAKMNKNNTVHPAGFVTTDDSWVNLLSQHPTANFGWRDGFSGMGLASFAKTLADSGAFSRCMVQKAYSAVCGENIMASEPARLQPIADDFEANGYNLKDLFTKVAIEDACISHPTGGQ